MAEPVRMACSAIFLTRMAPKTRARPQLSQPKSNEMTVTRTVPQTGFRASPLSREERQSRAGDRASMYPSSRISTICMENASSSQNPSVQHTSTSATLASLGRSASPKTRARIMVIPVRPKARIKGSGTDNLCFFIRVWFQV